SLKPPVVHRDFTPENLILLGDRQIKLIDFNVAQELESTSTKTVVGKHAYIPPEQFRGRAVIQSDIYALGGTLFFFLTGEDPEPITSVHPKEKVSSVSAELDAIVARATQPAVAQRYADSQAVMKDLLALRVKG